MDDAVPFSFGKQDGGRNVETELEKLRRLPNKPTTKQFVEDSKSEGDDDDEEEEEDYPISHALKFSGHSKLISSISVDPPGSRFLTASYDSTIKLYDFASISSSAIHPFKTITPSPNDSQPIYRAEFSPTGGGQHILVITASLQARILTRDGAQSVEFVKGDMYLRDMNITKGHVAEILDGCWHPCLDNTIVTSAADSTVRIWDINNKRSQREVLVFKSKQKGGRTKMTSVKWTDPKQGAPKLLAAAALDGTLVLWQGDGNFARPVAQVYDAHTADMATKGLAFSGDGRLLVSRGGDDKIKLWDTRKFKLPISERTLAANLCTNVNFSPDSSSILATSTDGLLHFLSPASLKDTDTTPIFSDVPSIKAVPTVSYWNSKLNQIFVGGSDGSSQILFSPKTSTKGALVCVARAPKKRHIDDGLTTSLSAGAVDPDSVHIPGMGGQKPRKIDPRKPVIPAPTPFGRFAPDEDHIQKNVAVEGMRGEDPRDALLKYADKANEDPLFTVAWKETQPTTIYRARTPSDDENDGPAAKKAKR